MDESYLEWLQVLPGFSAEKARKVAERFPTFEHLRAATPEELASVEGLSPHDLEALHRLARDPRGRDADGHLFLCPECGSFAGPASTECPFCGVSFEEYEEPAAVQEIDAFLKDEDEPALLCTTCGAVMPRGATQCDVCGRTYTPREAAVLPGLATSLEDAERLCPRCGAYMVPETLECAICGSERAQVPEAPKNGHNGHGLAEGFLSRWQRVSESAPVSEMDRLQEELEQYEKILEADPALERVWAKRGRVLAKMGRAIDAAESLAKAADLDPVRDEQYRLEVLDILSAKGDTSFLPPRWAQPRATAAPSPSNLRLVEALHHYEALLQEDPELIVAWRTKGEILGRLGRDDEARACFARADSLERHENDLLRARVSGLRAPGITPGGISVAGRTNGLGAGRTNGHVNGRTNGRVNGLAEGRVNGLTNGAAHGRGATNGLGGFTNGRTNGLVNGNGFTNGRRGRYGPSRVPAQPHWARSLVGIAAVIALMVLVPVLASILSPTPGGYAPIAIDHNFGEWARYTAYVNAPPTNLNNPDLNLLQVKVTTDASSLYVYAQVQGLFFQAPWTNGTESLLVFVDTDRNPATGYPVGDLGADLLAVVTGWDGQIRSTARYLFNETGVASSNDFRRFLSAGSVDAAFQGNQAELQVPMDSDPTAARFLVYAADNRGNRDAMAGIIQPARPTAVVDQTTVAPGVITNSTSPVLRLSLFPMGGAPWVSGLDVARRGSSADPVTLSAYADAGTGVFDPQARLLGQAWLSGSSIRLPVALNVTAPTTLWIAGTWANRTPASTFGLLVTGLAGNGTASVRPPDTTLDYLDSAPASPTVDGAFADWAGHAYGRDLLGDVVNGTGSLVYDSNVDLLATAVDAGANFTGYAQVDGHMLGGQDLPLDVSRPVPYSPSNTTNVTAPYVPQVGADVLYAYLDADNASSTGVRALVENVSYGFDDAIAIVGRNGIVESSSLYTAAANGTWQYAGPAKAAVDDHRVEFAVNASGLNLRVGYRTVYMSTDWRDQYDVALPDASVQYFALSAFAKPPSKNPPFIRLVKTVSATQAVPGTTLTYLLYFNNTGQGLAKTVSITDTMPTGVTFVSASAAPASVSGSTYNWVFTNVGPGSTNVLQITVQVNGDAADGSTVSNVATDVYTDQHGFVAGQGSASASFLYRRPVIVVTKTVSPANAVPGQTVTYTIYYNNTGSVPAGTVSIVDSLPSALTYTGSSPAPTAVSGGTYYWNFTNVAPGPHSITLTATVNSGTPSGSLVNWAYASYTSTRGFALAGSSSSATVAIPELSDFLFVVAVPILIIGLGRRAGRSRKEPK